MLRLHSQRANRPEESRATRAIQPAAACACMRARAQRRKLQLRSHRCIARRRPPRLAVSTAVSTMLAQLGAMVPSRACLLFSLIVAVSAHTSLIYPKPRNVRCSISCDIGPRGLRFSPQLLPNDGRCFLLQLPRRMRAALQPGHAREPRPRAHGCARLTPPFLRAGHRQQPPGVEWRKSALPVAALRRLSLRLQEWHACLRVRADMPVVLRRMHHRLR